MKDLIFCINDIVAGQRISPILSAPNKIVAINTFRQFCLSEEEKGLSRKMYRLEIVGDLFPNNDISVYKDSIIIQGSDVDAELKASLLELSEDEADV